MAEVERSTEVVECSVCEAKVRATVLSRKDFFQESSADFYSVLMLECQACKTPILGYCFIDFDLGPDDEFIEKYGPVKRVWPAPTRILSDALPKLVRNSIDEAQKCLLARAHSACVVMCGRALEALCKDNSIQMRSLADGLRELREKQIIDGRIYEWGQALRKARNIGAHASDIEINKDDAQDVFDFTIAICDYVYVLNDKYEKFKQREAERVRHKSQ